MPNNLLFTGPPGIGKTTFLERVVEELTAGGVRASGFCTAEVRGPGGGRLGFRYRTLDGREGWLAKRGRGAVHRVGPYGVLLEGLEAEAAPAIDPERSGAPCIVIDEIGRMEAFSQRFREAAERALQSPRVVLATVALKPGGWIGAVRLRPDARLERLTRDNRDALVGATVAAVLHMLGGNEA